MSLQLNEPLESKNIWGRGALIKIVLVERTWVWSPVKPVQVYMPTIPALGGGGRRILRWQASTLSQGHKGERSNNVGHPSLASFAQGCAYLNMSTNHTHPITHIMNLIWIQLTFKVTFSVNYLTKRLFAKPRTKYTKYQTYLKGIAVSKGFCFHHSSLYKQSLSDSYSATALFIPHSCENSVLHPV